MSPPGVHRRISMSTASNLSELNTALGGSTPITLTGHITINTALVIGRSKEINFNGFTFIKATGGSVEFLGLANAGRTQIFNDNWAAGDIHGTFRASVVYPEWWGLEPGHHDKAINKAIQALQAGLSASMISLDARTYDV